MNKISYFRKNLHERCAALDLPEAASAGESLLIEYGVCELNRGEAYADDLYNLAWIYDEMGITERASVLYTESINRILPAFGETPAFARRLSNLGALLSRQGNAAGAYRMFLQAAAIINNNSEKGSIEIADALYNLANAAADADRKEEALYLHNEALAIREKAGLTDDVINSMHSLAFLCESKKEYAKAAAYAQSAMEKAAGTEAYYSACYYLAELYGADEKHEKSKALYETVLKWVLEREGRNHSAYVTVATRLAYAAAGLGNFTEAMNLLSSALETLKIKTGEEYLCYAGCLRNLAMMHKELKEPEPAAEAMLKSLNIKKRIMGNHMPEHIQDVLFLISLYTEYDMPEKAMETLVYLLMHPNAAELKEPIDALIKIFTKKGVGNIKPLLEKLESYNNIETLRQIMDKWSEWEGGKRE